MPIYEYRCKICGKEFEVMQKITDEPLNICTYCNGELEKLISPTTFILKGSGWYATDYKNAKRAEEDKSSSEEKKKDDGKSEKTKD